MSDKEPVATPLDVEKLRKKIKELETLEILVQGALDEAKRGE